MGRTDVSAIKDACLCREDLSLTLSTHNKSPSISGDEHLHSYAHDLPAQSHLHIHMLKRK